MNTNDVKLAFEKPDAPFRVGQLLSKTWKAPYTNGLTDIWRQRCFEYWDRVSKRFGWVFSEPANDWSMDPIHGPVVTTFVTPLYEMPGERTAKRPDDLQVN
jgi:hypothetical protein